MEEVLPKPIIFEWDSGNQDKNSIKHKVKYIEAEQCFVNKPAILLHDAKHSKNEERYLLLGTTDAKRLLGIIFTTRANKIRIISARPMSRKERKLYAKT